MNEENEKKLSGVVNWLDDRELEGLYSSEYWNDITEEKKKEWWIAEGNYDRCRKYLDNSGLMAQWQVVEDFLNKAAYSSGLEVADLATGIGWTSALFSKLPQVTNVHATEISRHRLIKLFPHAVSMFSGDAAKIRRYIGSFYKLGFSNSSMDIVFLAQAFHHADQPLKLLSEIDRVLRPGGYLILIGENYIGSMQIIRRVVSYLVKSRTFTTNFYKLFPPDDQMGDHYYRLSDYYLFGQLIGFNVQHWVMQANSLVVIAKKHEHC